MDKTRLGSRFLGSVFLALVGAACESADPGPQRGDAAISDADLRDASLSDRGVSDSGVDAGSADSSSLVDAGGSDAAIPFDPEAAAQKLAEAFCDYTLRCRPSVISLEGQDASTCAAFASGYIIGNLRAIGNAIDEGRIEVDSALLDACASELAGFTCAPRPTRDLCRRFLRGTVTSSAACRFDYECVDGHYCDTPPAEDPCAYPASLGELRDFICMNNANTCATCTPFAQEGGSCDDRRCGPLAICADIGTPQAPDARCLNARLGLGQTCFTTTTGYCAFGYNCVGPAGLSVCTEDASENETCSEAGGPRLDAPRCGRDLFCSGGTCAPFTIGNVGASCDNNTAFCSLGHYCSNGGVCTSFPGVGQACLQGFCDGGSFCSGGMCVARLADGMSCQNDSQCARTSACVGLAGSQLCGSTSWAPCL